MDKATAAKRLEEERTRLQGIREGIQREQDDAIDDAGSELSSFDQHPGDSGTETFEMEKNVSLLEQGLERGSYGTCQVCGRPIGDERLEAMPATRFCVEDQAKAERQGGFPGPRD
jgi:RNA polymerase-binding transcription factor DksA